MKGWITIKSFKHKRLHLAGEMITKEEINPMWYDQLESQGLIRWVERPVIIMPKAKEPLQDKIPKTTARKVEKKPKKKKNVHKGNS